MKFWDSSAIVPLITIETESNTAKDLLTADPTMLVWMITTTEVHSALYRKFRGHDLSEKGLNEALHRLKHLSSAWSEVTNIEKTRQRANRLLAIHPLRAADALQLAAALVAFEDQPEGESFLTFDHNLSQAARMEGFQVN